MSEEKNKHLYEEAPVLKAVLALEIPTVISQLITVVYNMADTFFYRPGWQHQPGCRGIPRFFA